MACQCLVPRTLVRGGVLGLAIRSGREACKVAEPLSSLCHLSPKFMGPCLIEWVIMHLTRHFDAHTAIDWASGGHQVRFHPVLQC